jgi:hypothetical protein
VDEEEFDGCNSECRRKGKHSLRYGSCEFGKRPEPTLDFFIVEDGEDGYPLVGYAQIKASVFLPWLEDLPIDEQWDFLEKVARAKPEERSSIIRKKTPRKTTINITNPNWPGPTDTLRRIINLQNRFDPPSQA